MKKRIFAMLLSALLVANISACNYVPENDIDEKSKSTSDSIETTESNTSKPQNVLEYLNHNIPNHVTFESYDSIISAYRKIVELCPRTEEPTKDKYFSRFSEETLQLCDTIYIATMCLYPRDMNGVNSNCYEQFGYTVKDVNGDGVDELILRLDDHQVIAIFTMVNEHPVLLDYYWNRKNCWIDPDGYLHIGGSSGADRSVLQIYRISNKTGELILLEEGGTDGRDETSGNTLYYKLVNNEKIFISKKEYDIWKRDLPYRKFEVTETISEYMPFIPLFDEDHPSPEPYVPQAKG